MKKITLSIVMLFVGLTTLFGQDKISYNIVKDDPTFYIHVRGGAIVDADFLDGNTRSGFFTTVNLNLTDRLMLGADYIWGRGSWDQVAKNSITNVDKGYTDLSARASLFLSAKREKSNTKVTLKRETHSDMYYKYETEKFIHAPATTLTQIGLTGSAGYYQKSMLDNLKGDTLFILENKATNNIAPLKKAATHFSGMRFTGGLHISNTQSFEIDAVNTSTGENYGRRSVKKKVDVYIEAMYMPVISVEKNFVHKETGDEFMLNNEPSLRNLGYRLKVEYSSVSLLGLGLRFEFGQRPGLAYKVDKDSRLGGMYIDLGVMLSINK